MDSEDFSSINDINSLKIIIGNLEGNIEDCLMKNIKKNLICKHCSNIKQKQLLNCNHQGCKSCLKSRINYYLNNPSIESFKKFCCKKCKINFIDSDILNICGNDSEYQQFITLDFKKQCNKCDIGYNLHNGYFRELTCLHLCSNCYSDSLFFNKTSCNICKKPYENKFSTLSRTQACDNCKESNYYVKQSYRKICKSHVLCYDCLQQSAKLKACPVCQEITNKKLKKQEGKLILKILRQLINKKCSICKKIFALSEIDSDKTCCNLLVCLECKDEKICVGCRKELR